MTTLTIAPNWKNKTARFKGTIAAGEHVAVSIANDDNYITDTTNLRLRVVNPANGKTLAQFPMPETADDETDGENEVLPSSEAPAEGEADWASDLTPLFCILNLNTAQMLKAVPPAANVPLLFVLDAYKEASDGESGEFTLYFKDMCEVTHWPRRTGEDEPTNLDDYKDIIADFREDIYGEGGFKDRVESAESAAQSAAESARLAEEHAGNSESGAQAAMGAAQAAATNAANAKADAETAAENSAQAALAAQAAQSGAEAAQSAAEAAAEAAEAALPLDTTLSLTGKAADAKAVGDALALKADKSDTYTKSETDGKVAAEAQARTLLAATVQTHTSSLASLSSHVGDNETAIANRYTKSEVDAKVAGVQTFQKLVVNELPSAEAADDKTIYLVPRTGSETPDLCDEYVTVGAAGSRRWEKIGGGTVDLANYYTKAETNAALAGKASTADVTLTPIYGGNGERFGEWACNPATVDGLDLVVVDKSDEIPPLWGIEASGVGVVDELPYVADATNLFFANTGGGITATRTENPIIGYQLGSQSDKPLQPAGDYAPATGIQKSALAQSVQASLDKADTALQTAPVTSVNNKTGAVSLSASDVGALGNSGNQNLNGNLSFWNGNLAFTFEDAVLSPAISLWNGFQRIEFPPQSGTLALTSDIPSVAGLAPLASPAFTGTPTAPTPASGDNSTKVATTAFVKTAVDGVPLRYDMPSSVALVAENDEATLVCADRAVTNATIAAGFSTLNLTFPEAVNGKVRDFYLRIVVAAGESAPALSIPQGITIENPDGAVPEIADGETSAASTTLVWFSETAPNVFTAKSETVKAVA